MAFGGEIARLAQLFAQAAIDPLGWMPALAALASATRSGHGELVVVGGTPDTSQSWMSGGLPLDYERFIAAGGYRPGANPRIAASLRSRPLEIVHEADYDAVSPLLTDGDGVREVFHEGRIDAGCQTALVQEPGLLIGLAVLRDGRRHADGRTSAEDRATFAAAAPFVRDAALVQLGLERQGAALLAGAFEAMRAAAFLLDGAGRLAACTAAADALLADGRLRLVEQRLAARNRRDAEALAAAIGERLNPPVDAPPPPLATVALRGHDADAPPLLADVTALPRREWEFGTSPRVLVTIRGGGLRRQDAAALLRQLWDLSPAEIDVALRLARGEPRAAIATARRVSLETVRAQLKSIFAKAGVAREAEFTAKAAALLAEAG